MFTAMKMRTSSHSHWKKNVRQLHSLSTLMVRSSISSSLYGAPPQGEPLAVPLDQHVRENGGQDYDALDGLLPEGRDVDERQRVVEDAQEDGPQDQARYLPASPRRCSRRRARRPQ